MEVRLLDRVRLLIRGAAPRPSIVLAGALAFGLAVVPPVLPYPLNDEWLLVRMLQTLVTEHRYVQHEYMQPTAVALVAWAGVASALFGATLPVIRLSMVPFALLALWATTRCARVCGVPKGLSLLCGLTLLVNPIFFQLSTNFMTDVPASALSIVSASFYLWGLRTGRRRPVFWGSVAAAVGLFVRQFAILPALAYALIAVPCALVSRRRLTWPWAQTVAFAAPWIPAALGYWLWKSGSGGGRGWALFWSDRDALGRAADVTWYAGVALATVGLLVAPIAAARLHAVFTRRERWTRLEWGGFLAGVTLTAAALTVWGMLPRIPNTLDFAALGPRGIVGRPFTSLRPVYILQTVWAVASIIGAVAAGLLMATVVPALRLRVDNPGPRRAVQSWFLILWLGLVIATTWSPLTRMPFDRYLLPAFAAAAVLMAIPLRSPLSGAAMGSTGAALIVFYGFSLCVQHDYLAWNKTRWQIAHQLMQQGVGAHEIDGGYEFNGVHKSEEYKRRHGQRPFWNCVEAGNWFPLEERFRIAFSPLPGYPPLARYSYSSWLGAGPRDLYLLGWPAPGDPHRP